MHFYLGISQEEFLFISDEMLTLTKEESLSSLSVYDSDNFGSHNASILFVNFFDRLYYFLMYSIGFDTHDAQKALYTLKVFLLLLLPYLGFRQYQKRSSVTIPSAIIVCISLWYSFNTYTLIFWNANAFSLTLLVCYALAPLAFSCLERALLRKDGTAYDRVHSAILLFFMSFALPFFLAFAITFFVYSIILLCAQSVFSHRISGTKKAGLENIVSPVSFLSHLYTLFLLYIPFSFVYGLIVYAMVFTSGESMYQTGGEGYGNLQGSVLYPLLMWFSWGIYTYWEPRSTFTFYEYLHSAQALVAPFFLYGIIGYGLLRQGAKSVYLLAFSGAFLALLLLVKGAQEPFGAIYLYLLDTFSFFRAFRSPESKFGFVIVLLVAFLMLLSLKGVGVRATKYIALILVSVTLIQSWPLLSGEAIVGKNSPQSFDRVIRIPSDYKEVATYLNDANRVYGYFANFPSVEFGLFRLGDDTFIGQDLILKLVQLPFVSLAESSSLPVDIYQDLKDGEISQYRKYPIRYFILRTDAGIFDASVPKVLPETLPLVFQNKTFQVFENTEAARILERSTNEEVVFEKISPAHYRVSFEHMNGPEKLFFHENFSSDWKVYALEEGASISRKGGFFGAWSRYAETLSYTWRAGAFEGSHVISESGSNQWTVTPHQNGSLVLDVYYKPQSYLHWGFLGAVFSLGVYSFVLLRKLPSSNGASKPEMASSKTTPFSRSRVDE